ncbi:MAG: polysaccharide deacetylase family protein [Clostridia bacterium]|nr:polysaccharide deacetylase family protein [Clostridia bacterium]
MSSIVRIGKKIKKILRPSRPFITFSRRVNYVKTDLKVCAMTFDDGPMLLPASPDSFSGKALTEILLDTLDKYSAKGTFDIIGTTKDNYPDQAGKLGSASWGGIKFDHYPDIHLDNMGGAINGEKYIRRMIEDGHTLSNHGYRHIIYGKKPFVYGNREHFDCVNQVVEDTKKLNDYIAEKYNYRISLGRPPHYVDKIKNGFSSYDVYSVLGMNYLGASFDGGGWLPLGSIEQEIEDMVNPMKAALEQNPNAFCGKIIFQKDGYNMAKRTPVAFALEKQLKLLSDYGYTVTGVDKLMDISQFSDISPEHPLYEKLCVLSKTRPVVFSDNCLYLDKIMTKGEFALLLSSFETQKISTYKSRLSDAMNEVYGRNFNPASPVDKSIIKSFKEYFIEYPEDFSRYNIFKNILLT